MEAGIVFSCCPGLWAVKYKFKIRLDAASAGFSSLAMQMGHFSSYQADNEDLRAGLMFKTWKPRNIFLMTCNTLSVSMSERWYVVLYVRFGTRPICLQGGPLGPQVHYCTYRISSSISRWPSWKHLGRWLRNLMRYMRSMLGLLTVRGSTQTAVQCCSIREACITTRDDVSRLFVYIGVSKWALYHQ